MTPSEIPQKPSLPLPAYSVEFAILETGAADISIKYLQKENRESVIAKLVDFFIFLHSEKGLSSVIVSLAQESDPTLVEIARRLYLLDKEQFLASENRPLVAPSEVFERSSQNEAD